MAQPDDTRERGYAERLERLSGAGWKRWLDVQAPYRWNVRRLGLGHVLDVGCGIGRNLVHLGGDGVGIDHNPRAVQVARARGCRAFTPDEFAVSQFATEGSFDGLLLAHVVEHMHFAEAVRLLEEHLRFVRPGGRVVLIAPQEAGYRSDPTHVEFMEHERAYSFPFPRFVGRIFPHNEFVAVGRRP